jgi:tetratricopeptide (TPR) repeat protein
VQIYSNDKYRAVPSRTKPTLKLDSGIDPRQLSKYLDLLQTISNQNDKEKQIMEWYYTEQINLHLKEALIVVIGKLQSFLSQTEIKIKQIDQGDNLLADGIKQLHIAASTHNFENLDKIRDRILKRLKEDEHKSEIYNFCGEIYRNIGIQNKTISNFKKSLDYNSLNFVAIINLANAYINSEDYNKVEEIIIEAIKVFRKKNPEKISLLLNLLAQSKIYSSNFLEAKQILLQAKAAISGNEDSNKLIDINLILVLVHNFEMDEARKMILEVGKAIDKNFNIEVAQTLQYSQIPSLYNTIAIYYAVDNQFQKAKEFSEKSAKVSEMLGNSKFLKPFDYLIINTNLAYLCLYIGDFESFQKYNQVVRDISIDFFDANSFAFAKSYANQGIFHLIQGNKESAFKNFFRAFQLLSATSNNRNNLIRASIYADIANVYCWKKNYEDAKLFYLKAREHLEANFGKNNPNLQRINWKIKNIESGQNIILPF